MRGEAHALILCLWQWCCQTMQPIGARSLTRNSRTNLVYLGKSTFGRVDERPSELKAEHVLMPRIGYRLCWSTQPSCRLETGGPVIGTKAALCLSSWAGRLGVPKAFDQTTSRKQTRLELATRSRNALAAAEHSDDRYEETP